MPLADTDTVSLMPNLGEKSARMLRGIGIHTVGDLRAAGPIEAFRRLRWIGERPSLVLLWAMVAGLRNEHWQRVGTDEKQTLLTQLNAD